MPKYKCINRCYMDRVYNVGDILRPGTKPNAHFIKVDGKESVPYKAPPAPPGQAEAVKEPTMLSEILEREEAQREEVRLPDAAKGDKPSSIFE